MVTLYPQISPVNRKAHLRKATDSTMHYPGTRYKTEQMQIRFRISTPRPKHDAASHPQHSLLVVGCRYVHALGRIASVGLDILGHEVHSLDPYFFLVMFINYHTSGQIRLYEIRL